MRSETRAPRPTSAAEFLSATGGDLTAFETADRFAGVAGLAPAPRDSSRITANHHRPHRYDRRLLRVFYLSGLSALKSCPASRTFYDRKRAEGKTHVQAMLALARRRLKVLWAMFRDGTTYTPAPPQAAGLTARAFATRERGKCSGPSRYPRSVNGADRARALVRSQLGRLR